MRLFNLTTCRHIVHRSMKFRPALTVGEWQYLISPLTDLAACLPTLVASMAAGNTRRAPPRFLISFDKVANMAADNTSITRRAPTKFLISFDNRVSWLRGTLLWQPGGKTVHGNLIHFNSERSSLNQTQTIIGTNRLLFSDLLI